VKQMIDLEKVIKGLEECLGTGNCMKCQYGKEKPSLSCKKLLSDALELIKSSRLIHKEHALYTVYEPHNGGDDMADRKKVIKGLECHKIDNNHRINCADCPYYVNDDNHIRCVNDLHDDALALLKEQGDGLKHYDDGSIEV